MSPARDPLTVVRAVLRGMRVPRYLREDAEAAGLLGYVKALRRWQPERGAFRTWAGHLIRGEVRELLRTEARAQERVDRLAERVGGRRRVYLLWHDCPADTRQLLEADAAGYTHDEIARALGCSRPTVVRRMAAARTQAHRYMEEDPR